VVGWFGGGFAAPEVFGESAQNQPIVALSRADKFCCEVAVGETKIVGCTRRS
jgi:hypothetical protein